MKIFTADRNIPLLKETLQQKHKVYEFIANNLTNEELISNQTEFLIVRSTLKVNEELLKGTKVKFVATATAGIDHIDTDYLRKKDIHFMSAAGANSNSVAEYVVYSFLLWQQKKNIPFDKIRLGIIGFGNIGRKVKTYFDVLGIDILVNDPPLADANFDKQNFCQLDEIIKNCNVITVHTPMILDGKYKTFHLLDKTKINQISSHSLIINAARGGIVDENSLLNRANEIDFVLDVWEAEPNVNLELAKSAILATPHIAGHSYEGKLKATKMIIDELNKVYDLNLDMTEINSHLTNDIILTKEDFKNVALVFTELEKQRQLKKDAEFLLSLKTDATSALVFKKFRNEYPKRFETLFLSR